MNVNYRKFRNYNPTTKNHLSFSHLDIIAVIILKMYQLRAWTLGQPACLGTDPGLVTVGPGASH